MVLQTKWLKLGAIGAEIVLKLAGAALMYYGIRFWWLIERPFVTQTVENFATCMALAFFILLLSLPSQIDEVAEEEEDEE